jgi:hypothetical protein
MPQEKNQNSEINDESKSEKLLDPTEDPNVGSASEPHDYLAVTRSNVNCAVVRCPNCERLVGLNKIGENAFCLERL